MAAGGPTGGASFEATARTLHPDVVLHHSPDLPWGRATGVVVSAPMVQIVRVDHDLIFDFHAFYWNVPQYLKAYEL